MGSPTDRDTTIADRLAAIDGAVARRDAIANELAETYQVGVRDGASARPTKETVAHIHPWDLFAAAALQGIIANGANSSFEDDIKQAIETADDMVRASGEAREKGRKR